MIAINSVEIPSRVAPWAPPAYGQSHTYADAVVRAGGIPLIVPQINDQLALRKLYEQCDGLLLCGGDDVGPSVYNAKKSPLTKCSPEWCDKQELQLLKWALADGKPVLGICRGMQLINVALGGTLHQDIASDLPAASDHQLSEHRKDFRLLAHRLNISPGSRLAAILDTNGIDANSLHHQAVNKLGNGLVVTARTEDKVVEAIELPGTDFVIGVQSHPESLEAETEPAWRSLFIGFVKSASRPKQ